MLDKIQSIFIFVVATIGGTTKGVLSINTLNYSSANNLLNTNILHYLFMLIITTVLSGIIAFITTIACKHCYKKFMLYINLRKNKKS